MTKVTNEQLSFFAATPKTLSSKVEGAKRPEQLKVPFSQLVIMAGWNIRKEINEEHVENLMIAFANGQEPSDFMTQPVEFDSATLLAVLGGHHTHTAIDRIISIQAAGNPSNEFEEMICNGPQFTNETLFTVKLSKAANEAERIIQAYNHNQGLDMTYLDKARTYQTLRTEGLSVTDIANKLGVRKSVVSNALFLLNGDAELLELVESNQISGTKAMHLLREYGADKATEYAKASIGIFEDVTEQLPETTRTESVVLEANFTQQQEQQLPVGGTVTTNNNESVETEISTQDAASLTTRKAAKQHAPRKQSKGGLTPAQQVQRDSLFLLMASKSEALQLPEAVQNEIDKMVKLLKDGAAVTQE